MTKNSHRSVKMTGQAHDQDVTVLSVSIAFAITALVSIAVLLSGTVNLAAASIFIFFPLIAFLTFGRAVSISFAWASGFALFGLMAIMSFFPVPPGLEIVKSVVTIFAIALGGACLALLAMRLRDQQGGGSEDSTELSAASPVETDLPGDLPALILETTALGRLVRRFGNTVWYPGVQPGSVLDRDMLDEAGLPLKPGVQTLGTGDVVLVERQVGPDGEVWIICALPPGAGSQSEIEPLREELKARTAFFAGLGHDLKSPLNSVMGFAEMMEGEVLGPMPDVYRDYPGLIREGANTLLRLVEDMLNYARAEAGTFELDLGPIDIAASGEAVMRQSQAAAKSAGIMLQVKAPGEVMAFADANAVYRIWDNLVSNAIKYSDEGGLVRLTASQKGDQVVLSVIDHGAGMDADDVSRVTKPFSQGKNAKGRNGTGLGLAMVKTLAELQGGRMVIHTALGQGTKVSVYLPALAAQDDARAAE